MSSEATLDQPNAVLWDFDGTLVDTESLWFEIETDLLAEHGVVWSEQRRAEVIGRSAWFTCGLISEDTGVPTADLVDEIHNRVAADLRANGLPFLPGTLDLVAELEANRVPCAVVTSSYAHVMDVAQPLLPQAFDFLIHADHVANPKPSPEGYLMACDRLGIDPAEVLVLEDSVPGAQAALTAGARVLAVGPVRPTIEDPKLAWRSGLDGVTWDGLSEVWRSLA